MDCWLVIAALRSLYQEPEHERQQSSVIEYKARSISKEQGQAHRPEAAVAAGTCVVNPSQVATGGRTRDLALLNLAIDGKLRACDLVALRVDDEIAEKIDL